MIQSKLLDLFILFFLIVVYGSVKLLILLPYIFFIFIERLPNKIMDQEKSLCLMFGSFP
jgi:hypothetical protein